MLLRVFTEPQQGASYDDLLRVARAAEDLGFDAFFRSDHYQAIGGGLPGNPDSSPGPTDAWITLAGLARETSTIRLGTLMTPATFRLPGPLAISVAQVDAMSGGRVELGFGSGWYAAEHASYGIPFPPLGERFDRYEEQLEIITGLWAASGRYEHRGGHYELTDSPALPKPLQSPRPPLLIGGKGPRRTPRLAARYADEYNVPVAPVERVRELFDGVRAAVDATDRGAEWPMRYSVALCVACGRTEAEAKRRADAIGMSTDDLAAEGLFGTPAQVLDRLAAYGGIGASRVYLQLLDLNDLDHLQLIAAEVAPHLPS